ncbi:MAG TPA: NUDIX domain-containing protein [Acidimicrobiales bacterium]
MRLLDPDDPLLAPSADLAVARAHVAAAGPFGLDEALRRQVLDFVDAHPDALHRSCAEGHLTGSAMVVDPASERFLFMLHAKVGRWLQPGGHADGDAALPAVALREATEETGIEGLRVAVPAVDVDVHLFVAPGEVSHLHLDARYLVVAPPGAVPRANHESRGLRWAGVDELDGLGLDPGTHRLAHAALAALRALPPP